MKKSMKDGRDANKRVTKTREPKGASGLSKYWIRQDTCDTTNEAVPIE